MYAGLPWLHAISSTWRYPMEGMRAAIFAVTLDAKKLGKGHTENPVLASVQKSNRYKGRIVSDCAY